MQLIKENTMRELNLDEVKVVPGGDDVSQQVGYWIGYSIGYVVGGQAGKDLGSWLYDTVNT